MDKLNVFASPYLSSCILLQPSNRLRVIVWKRYIPGMYMVMNLTPNSEKREKKCIILTYTQIMKLQVKLKVQFQMYHAILSLTHFLAHGLVSLSSSDNGLIESYKFTNPFKLHSAYICSFSILCSFSAPSLFSQFKALQYEYHFSQKLIRSPRL